MKELKTLARDHRLLTQDLDKLTDEELSEFMEEMNEIDPFDEGNFDGESNEDKAKDQVASVEEIAIEEEYAAAEASEPLQASLPDELNNLAITEEESQTEIEKGEIISATKVGEAASFHTEPKYKEYKGEEMWQMEEIYHYWMDYKLDAVDDLIHLPRVRTITNELKGSNDFYYYGQTDGKGKPSGSGLAVYADNTYYCGDWKDGKRHGKGMWWKIFPDKTGTINGVPGVTAHSYNGTWANDYPNGEGQEHFDFDYSLVKGEYVITNVIGNFKDGYYDGSTKKNYFMIGDEKIYSGVLLRTSVHLSFDSDMVDATIVFSALGWTALGILASDEAHESAFALANLTDSGYTSVTFTVAMQEEVSSIIAEDETVLKIGADDECVKEITLSKDMKPTTYTVELGEDCERLLFFLECTVEDDASHTYAIYDITLNK